MRQYQISVSFARDKNEYFFVKVPIFNCQESLSQQDLEFFHE